MRSTGEAASAGEHGYGPRAGLVCDEAKAAPSHDPQPKAPRHHGNVGPFLYDSGRDASADVAGLVEAWADCLAPDYGMIHSLCESERREATNPWRSDIDADGARGHAIWGFTPQLRHGLPTIYWRNFFGAPYIAAFGRSRLLSAPAYRAIEYPWGVEIQVTAEPPTEASYPSYREARDRLIEYLGQDLCIDPQHGSARSHVVFEQLDSGPMGR
jgi:hypothetical protein